MQRRIRKGDPPTLREVQAAFRFAAVESARQHLKALVASGDLIRLPGRARGFALPGQRRLLLPVPILGQVQAGELTTALEDPEGVIELPIRGDEEHFVLRVAGESMTGAGIHPGDLLLVRRAQSAASGAIVVALIDDEATVKRIEITPKSTVLHPENENYSSIRISEHESLRLLGVVVEVHRYFEGVPSSEL
jgi:repressor LexA